MGRFKLPGILYGRFKVGYFAMPKISEKKMLLKDLNDILKVLVIDGNESTKEFSEIMEITSSLSTHRFMNARNPIPKNQDWKELFFAFPER